MFDRWAIRGLAGVVLVVGCGEPAALTASYAGGAEHRRVMPDAGGDTDAAGQGGMRQDGGGNVGGPDGRGPDASDGGDEPAPTNPIVVENALPGTAEWAIAE